MSRDSIVIPLRQPEAIDDPLSELAREGARRMLAQVLIAEADSFVAMWKDLKLPDGRDRVVRHGHGPHRTIQTGVGPVEVRRAKVRDRGDVGAEEESASARRSCRSGRGGRRASMRCYRFSTCVGCRPATSRRRLAPSWARTRRTYAGGDFAAHRRMADGLRRLAEARPLGAAIRVCVGGRGLPAGPDGRSRRMYDRCC